MSGQTYTTTIRIPTPQELAAQVAAAARGQGTAGASGVRGRDAVQAAARLRAEALRFVVETVAPLARPVTGTARACVTTAAEVELRVSGFRVPVRVEVDPGRPAAGRLTLSFDHAQGLTCAQEAQIAGEVVALFARTAVQDPTGGETGALPGAPARREAGA